MKITFLGTGTSQGVPVIACSCEVCCSADTYDKRLRSSVLIETNDKTFVIDSGPDFRYQLLRNDVKRLDAIIFTHEHKDHVAGLDDVRAFNYVQQCPMDVYAHKRVQEALKREFHYIFTETYLPGLPKINLLDISKENTFFIGETSIIPIEVLHYKLPVLGFRIGDFAYITDAKTISDEEKEKLNGVKILVINSLQKEYHHSHFTLEEALSFAKTINAKHTYLTHISHKLGKHSTVSSELPQGISLAYDGLSIML